MITHNIYLSIRQIETDQGFTCRWKEKSPTLVLPTASGDAIPYGQPGWRRFIRHISKSNSDSFFRREGLPTHLLNLVMC